MYNLMVQKYGQKCRARRSKNQSSAGSPFFQHDPVTYGHHSRRTVAGRIQLAPAIDQLNVKPAPSGYQAD